MDDSCGEKLEEPVVVVVVFCCCCCFFCLFFFCFFFLHLNESNLTYISKTALYYDCYFIRALVES